MRRSLKLAAVLMTSGFSLSLAMMASAATRATGSHPSHGAAVISQAWYSRLNLTPDQQTKVQAANDTYRADMEKARSLTASDQKKEAARQAHKAYRDAIQAVLTPEQQNQLKSMMAEAREYHDLGPVGVQLVGLNLTSEQQGKIKEIAARHQPEIEKLHSSLRDATDKKPVRNQIRDLQAKMLDEVKAALTPGQIAQLQPAGRRLQASK